MTSKLTSLEHLDNLHTFGFHGEALFNIIKLSHSFEVITRKAPHGKFYLKKFNQAHSDSIEHLENYVPSTNAFNTFFSIDKLFWNHSIRKAQLKSSSRKLNSLLHRLEILSLAHFKTSVTLEDLTEKNKILFHSEKATNQNDRFIKFYGPQFSQFLKTFTIQNDQYTVSGIINSYNKENSINLQSSNLQFIFINKRYLLNKEIYELVSNELSSCR